jgi:predicted short-subunit dehydrogenase-like oxidoreductase (DUF2520 family)
MDKKKTFVCIGAGNVATHLAKALCNNGYRLIQVYSRTINSARELANAHQAEFTNSSSKLLPLADFYLVSIPDQTMAELLYKIEFHDKLIFHTAGSSGLEVFGNKFKHFGVMYPLQTFTKNTALKISEIPFLIEASDEKSLEKIEVIARDISERVYVTDAETRRWIHLAAVFACNFTNHMLVLSDRILKDKNIDPSILRPLIEETLGKSVYMDPAEAQTGPAVRGDFATIDKHIKMLENQSLLQKIYTFTTESIRNSKLNPRQE